MPVIGDGNCQTRGALSAFNTERQHGDMNSQPENGYQQQSDNGCNHQGQNQNHKPEHVDGAETQDLPKPILEPHIQYTQLFINNEWQESCSGRKIPVTDATSGKLLCEVEEADSVSISYML
ncbi:aldehyde dehydrogenase 1A1-like [Gasterosteus aculeatus]